MLLVQNTSVHGSCFNVQGSAHLLIVWRAAVAATAGAAGLSKPMEQTADEAVGSHTSSLGQGRGLVCHCRLRH